MSPFINKVSLGSVYVFLIVNVLLLSTVNSSFTSTHSCEKFRVRKANNSRHSLTRFCKQLNFRMFTGTQDKTVHKSWQCTEEQHNISMFVRRNKQRWSGLWGRKNLMESVRMSVESAHEMPDGLKVLEWSFSLAAGTVGLCDVERSWSSMKRQPCGEQQASVSPLPSLALLLSSSFTVSTDSRADEAESETAVRMRRMMMKTPRVRAAFHTHTFSPSSLSALVWERQQSPVRWREWRRLWQSSQFPRTPRRPKSPSTCHLWDGKFREWATRSFTWWRN